MKKQKWFALATMGLVVSSMGFGTGEVAFACVSEASTEQNCVRPVDSWYITPPSYEDFLKEKAAENAAATANVAAKQATDGVVKNATPKSSVVLYGVEGKGKAHGPNPVLKKQLAFRTAKLVAISNAVKETEGATRGVITNITAEDYDGETYTIVADVQV